MRLDSLAAQVAAIAHEAGEAIMKVYNDTADVQVTHKADDSPLTLADRAANEVINNGLAMLQVQYPIISEENKLVDYDVRAAYDTYWLVDPLDGTKEFIKRNGEFTVNIALIRGGEAILGVVYAPVPDEMYWGARGFGAWRMKDGATQKMTATAFSMSDSGLKLVSSRSHLNTETEEYIAQFDAPELVSKGSSVIEPWIMGVERNDSVNLQQSSSYSTDITFPNAVSISDVVPVAAPTLSEDIPSGWCKIWSIRSDKIFLRTVNHQFFLSRL